MWTQRDQGLVECCSGGLLHQGLLCVYGSCKNCKQPHDKLNWFCAATEMKLLVSIPFLLFALEQTAAMLLAHKQLDRKKKRNMFIV